MTKHKVAILIPTLNRSNFLSRKLRYYASVKSPHPVYIGDGSDEEHRKTMEKVVELAPDRICLNYLHVSQEFAPHQKLMEKDVELPDVQERKLIFLSALETLLNGGYVRTGYDHFAKPSDEVAKSMEEKTMHWNSLGYTPGKCLDILGLGVHSYSSLNGIYYTQNVYEEPLYKTMLDSGEFPILRGYELNMDDVIRRDVINALRGYFLVDLREMEKKHNIDDINNYFKKEIADLNKFVKDGLVEMSQDVIYITDQGKEFADNVCKHFDKF